MALHSCNCDKGERLTFVVALSWLRLCFGDIEPGSATRCDLNVSVWLTTLLVICGVATMTALCGFDSYFFISKKKTKKDQTGLLAVLGGIASPPFRPIADTAATIHAVGDRSLLRGLQIYPIPESVELPNGTSLPILGIGSIDFEHFQIPNVYLVEGFQKCVISMSQLDRQHGIHSCFGRGIGRIMLADGTEVGGAILDEHDGMYVLKFLVVPNPPASEKLDKGQLKHRGS